MSSGSDTLERTEITKSPFMWCVGLASKCKISFNQEPQWNSVRQFEQRRKQLLRCVFEMRMFADGQTKPFVYVRFCFCVQFYETMNLYHHYNLSTLEEHKEATPFHVYPHGLYVWLIWVSRWTVGHKRRPANQRGTVWLLVCCCTFSSHGYAHKSLPVLLMLLNTVWLLPCRNFYYIMMVSVREDFKQSSLCTHWLITSRVLKNRVRDTLHHSDKNKSTLCIKRPCVIRVFNISSLYEGRDTGVALLCCPLTAPRGIRRETSLPLLQALTSHAHSSHHHQQPRGDWYPVTICEEWSLLKGCRKCNMCLLLRSWQHTCTQYMTYPQTDLFSVVYLGQVHANCLSWAMWACTHAHEYPSQSLSDPLFFPPSLTILYFTVFLMLLRI